MKPDSYENLDGVKTSSTEDRHAIDRRPEHHVHLMTQKNFIPFNLYQQALRTVIDMHRDKETDCL